MRIKLGTHSSYEEQGTDIYIKKLDSGASHGQGYSIQVYDYGQLVSEITVPTKKDVRKVIDQQKEKYVTDRAFEEESHLFVSYRIDDVESSKFRTKHDIQVKESTMNIDDRLYKQASHINNLLSAVQDPAVPIKFFKKANQLFDFNGETADTSNNGEGAAEDTTAQKDTPEATAQQISERIDSYLTSMENGPRDDVFNELQKFVATVKNILNSANYDETERKQIISILANKYKNSGIPNADLLFKKSSMTTIVKTSGALISGPIQTDVLGNTVQQNAPLKPLGTNASPAASNNTGSGDFNSKSESADNNSLSPEASNLVDKINTLNGDPMAIYDAISNTPNNTDLVNEIKQKKDPSNQTEAVNNVLNYQANYAEGLYKFAGGELSKFHSQAKKQKGVRSFTQAFTKWASTKHYNALETYVVNMRKASFIDTAIHQLQNNGELPIDFFYKQASEKYIVNYFVRLGMGELSLDQRSTTLQMILNDIYSANLSGASPQVNAVEAISPIKDEQEKVNSIIKSIPEDRYLQAILEVAKFMTTDAVKANFATEWSKSTQDVASFTPAFNKVWGLFNYTLLGQHILGALKPILDRYSASSTQANPQINGIALKLTDELYKYFGSLISTFISKDNAVFYAELKKLVDSTRTELKSTYLGNVQAGLVGKVKHAVNIIINESASGGSDVTVEEDAGQPQEFHESNIGNALETANTSGTLGDVSLETNPNQDLLGEEPFAENAGEPLSTPAISTLEEEPSLFDELNI